MRRSFFKLSLYTGAISAVFAASAQAEVIASSPSYYELRHEARSELSPAELWDRLVDPASWWHPEHTYSGDSANLSLDLQAGGLWREDWDGGSVVHGTVLYVEPGKSLRLNAPFGPLQELAVVTIWTITVEPDGEGSVVRFVELSSGSEVSGLDEMAPAVDYVKTEAIGRLTGPE